MVTSTDQESLSIWSGDGFVKQRDIEVNPQGLLDKLHLLLEEIALGFHVVEKKATGSVREEMEQVFLTAEIVGL